MTLTSRSPRFSPESPPDAFFAHLYEIGITRISNAGNADSGPA